jgi:hypothetical protein
MRAVIRLAVCTLLAASSTAALAQGNDASSSGDVQQNVKDQDTRATTNATTPSDDKDADVGAASGEPTRSDASAKADARTREEAAARDYDKQLRQTEIWTSP